MKAISIREPWAGAIADGRKTIEIRSWRTYHTGPLLICSTAPDSSALCVVTIANILRMRPCDEATSFCPLHAGALAWHLTRPCPVKRFRVAGRQGLFEVPDALIHPRLPSSQSPADFHPAIRQWLIQHAIDTNFRAR